MWRSALIRRNKALIFGSLLWFLTLWSNDAQLQKIYAQLQTIWSSALKFDAQLQKNWRSALNIGRSASKNSTLSFVNCSEDWNFFLCFNWTSKATQSWPTLNVNLICISKKTVNNIFYITLLFFFLGPFWISQQCFFRWRVKKKEEKNYFFFTFQFIIFFWAYKHVCDDVT